MLVLLALAGVFGVLSFLLGEFEEWQWKILGTLFILVSLCVGVLSSSLMFGTRYSAVGATGILVSALATATLLTILWFDYSAVDDISAIIEPLARFAGVTATLSIACVVTSLLLHLTRHGTGAITKLVWATIGFVLVDTLIISTLILSPDFPQEGAFLLRLLGATSVLATVGIIGTPIMALISKGKKNDRQEDQQPQH
jgi:hypothetical protein